MAAMACSPSPNLLAAMAPGFITLAIGRVVLALAAGAFMPTASAYAAMAVTPDMRGRALAFVYSGMTVALVIGVPLGTAVAAHLGWRATFAGVAALSLVVLAGIALKLPAVANPGAASLAERLAVARRPDVLASSASPSSPSPAPSASTLCRRLFRDGLWCVAGNRGADPGAGRRGGRLRQQWAAMPPTAGTARASSRCCSS